MTTPLPFAWPHALIFWAVYVWVFVPEFRILGRTSLSRPTPVEDRGSLRVLTFGFSAAVMAAFLFPFAAPWAELPGRRAVWFFVGVLLMIAGSLLRRHCFRVLGRFFTGAVTIQEGHRVIDTGAYRWVRHPSYSAALIIVLGIATAPGNWIGVVVAFAVALAGYSYRARVEERALLASLGDPYARFMASRKRFIPFLW